MYAQCTMNTRVLANPNYTSTHHIEVWERDGRTPKKDMSHCFHIDSGCLSYAKRNPIKQHAAIDGSASRDT